MSVKLTQRAATELKRMLTERSRPESTIVRFAVAGGGCSGFEYKMEFVDTPVAEEDVVSEAHGVRIAVDHRSLKFFSGTEIDYHDDLIKRGFVFNNPLAVKTCGCGSSFQV